MKPDMKKLLLLNAPYLIFVWLFSKLGAAYRLTPGFDLSEKFLNLSYCKRTLRLRKKQKSEKIRKMPKNAEKSTFL